jgi:hypothetical protein
VVILYVDVDHYCFFFHNSRLKVKGFLYFQLNKDITSIAALDEGLPLVLPSGSLLAYAY